MPFINDKEYARDQRFKRLTFILQLTILVVLVVHLVLSVLTLQESREPKAMQQAQEQPVVSASNTRGTR